MESEDRKFYVTANRILDADVIGDVQYHPAGSSELFIAFKDPEKESISLSETKRTRRGIISEKLWWVHGGTAFTLERKRRRNPNRAGDLLTVFSFANGGDVFDLPWNSSPVNLWFARHSNQA